MIRVLLADDHPVLRQGLARLLLDHPDLRVVGEAGTADELFALLPDGGADVVVLDVSMPGPGVGEVLRRLAANHPRVRVLVLSGHAEEQYAVRVLKAGAAGYLTKERSAEDLVTAVRRVAQGGRYVSQTLAERLASELGQSDSAAPHEQLSSREFAVLQGIAAGLTLKEIAARLALSPKTVSTYRARILAKLGLSSTADLVRYVVERGLQDHSMKKSV